MVHVLGRHKVEDFAKWKKVYDETVPYMKEKAALIKETVFQNSENPNEVFVLIECESREKAQEYLESDYLKEKMQQSGVAGKPDIYYLEEAN
jgi:quinol monooxygenase YgiN